MDDCQRCSGRLPWDSGVTMLRGETEALLCLPCRNAWHTYFLTLPEYETICELKSQALWLQGRATAGDAPTADEWRAHVAAQQTCQARLFALGQAWLAGPVAVEVPDAND
jgi:hypothetical protein